MSNEQIPVLVGAAQLLDHEADPTLVPNPLEMLTRVGREAAAQAGPAKAVLEAIDTIALVEVLAWHPQNGPRLVGEQLGCTSLKGEYDCATGGETPVALINLMAERICKGESDVALVAGCNNIKSLRAAGKREIHLDWPSGGSGTPSSYGKTRLGGNEEEIRYGLNLPPTIYPIFENALRAARGQSLDEHRTAMGALMNPFTKVAANNPDAWFPVERSAQELVTPSEQNRMVSFPYTKYLNAFLDTDQAAGVLLMSQAKARALGVPESNWVYWRAGANQNESQWYASQRPDFAKCPALRGCHDAALSRAGIELADVGAFDLYSCFPVAVSMACEMLGIDQDDPRDFTVTGGLPYAGGPASAYSLHGVAAMQNRIRNGAAKTGMVTGNGWYLTKHSALVLSSEPGESKGPSTFGQAWAADSQEAQVPEVAIQDEATGEASVETYTMIYGRDGRPLRGIVVGRLDDGARFLANTPSDLAINEAVVASEFIGQRGQVRHIDGSNVFEPR